MPYNNIEEQKAAQHRSYLKNKEAVNARNTLRRKLRKDWMVEVLAERYCTVCHESASECLDFHHMDSTMKDDLVTALLNEFRSMVRVIAEIEKCVLLCANCHRKHHKGTLGRVFTDEDCVRLEEGQVGDRLKGL